MHSRAAGLILGLLLLVLAGCGGAPRPGGEQVVAKPSPMPAATSTSTREARTDPTPAEVEDDADGVTEMVPAAEATEVLIPAPTPPEPGDNGLVTYDERASSGYTLFNPQRSKTTYLIDIHGNVVHVWESAYPSPNSAYLTENGSLLRPAVKERNEVFGQAGGSGTVQELDWEGEVLWEFEYSSDQVRLHHDIEPLPSGNVLMIAWEMKSAEEAMAAGRNPDLLAEGGLWPDHIIEVDPATNEIVWEWHVWDHLIQDLYPDKENYGVVAEHPELLDINHSQGRVLTDMNHINSIDYDPELDQILLSVHKTNEIWIIDHSTTTVEAAGHSGGNSGMGGDIVYRWGNPQVYHRGSADDQQLFLQHDAHWIAKDLDGGGNILIFNNGHGRKRAFSSVVEIVPPGNADGSYATLEEGAGGVFGPSEPWWIYAAENPEDFYAANLSGAQRLPNGNTLICDGPTGTLFEITEEGEIVWTYVNPFAGQGPRGEQYHVFRAHRYSPDYPGLVGRGLD